MEIITFNVGQGCFVVVRDDHEAIVVDTHIPASEDSRSEHVKQALSIAVRHRNVRGLILTGFDRDHSDARGVSIVLNKYCPDWVIYPKYFKDTLSASDVFDVINTIKRRRPEFERISVRIDDPSKRFLLNLCSNMTFECFSPHPDEMDSSNNCSLVVKVRAPTLSYLITGDTENARWASINRIFRSDIKSDIMAAPHHGSINGANETTLRFVQPHTVLVSAGVNNQFGHPHQQAMAIFQRVAREVHSTNYRGKTLWTRKENGKIVTTHCDLT